MLLTALAIGFVATTALGMDQKKSPTTINLPRKAFQVGLDCRFDMKNFEKELKSAGFEDKSLNNKKQEVMMLQRDCIAQRHETMKNSFSY